MEPPQAEPAPPSPEPIAPAEVDDDAALRARARAARIVLLLVVATLVALFPVIWGGFVDFDDLSTIVQNPRMNDAGLQSAGYYWNHADMGLYMPLTWDVWVGLSSASHLPAPVTDGSRIDPRLFHETNLLLHLLAVLTAWRLLCRFTDKPWLAAIGALLFAVHPLQVEAVAWVSGLKDVLSGWLTLLALLGYAHFAKPIGKEDPDARWGWYALATLALAGALLSKPAAVVAPLLALCLDGFLLRKQWRLAVLQLIPWFVLAALAGWAAYHLQAEQSSAVAVSFAWRPVLALQAIGFYLAKFFLPRHLAIDYALPPKVMVKTLLAQPYWALPVALLLIGVLLAGLKKSARPILKGIGIGALFSLLAIVPILGIVSFEFMGYSLVANHYLYVAMFGIALSVLFALPLLRDKRVIAGIAVIVLAGWAWDAHRQAGYWQDTTALMNHLRIVSPDSRIWPGALSRVARLNRNYSQAEDIAREALQRHPDDYFACNALGQALNYQQKYAEAESVFVKGLALAPSYSPLLSGQAAAIVGQQNDPEHREQAFKLLQQALDADNNNAIAWRLAGKIAIDSHQYPDAIMPLERALKINPQDAAAHYYLARAEDLAGHFQEADEQYRLTLEIDPANPDAHFFYAVLLNHYPRTRDASIAHLRAALAARPDFQEAKDALAKLGASPATGPGTK